LLYVLPFSLSNFLLLPCLRFSFLRFYIALLLVAVPFPALPFAALQIFALSFTILHFPASLSATAAMAAPPLEIVSLDPLCYELLARWPPVLCHDSNNLVTGRWPIGVRVLVYYVI
jgi:hypothetical protein